MPLLFYEGKLFKCVLSEEAMSQLGITEDSEEIPKEICNEDSEELIHRIIMYCDGEHLEIPFELNGEGTPFWALKTARPQSLRAYFWMDGDNMVISHFIKKDSPKLRSEDKAKMRYIKDQYDRNGGY